MTRQRVPDYTEGPDIRYGLASLFAGLFLLAARWLGRRPQP